MTSNVPKKLNSTMETAIKNLNDRIGRVIRERIEHTDVSPPAQRMESENFEQFLRDQPSTSYLTYTRPVQDLIDSHKKLQAVGASSPVSECTHTQTVSVCGICFLHNYLVIFHFLIIVYVPSYLDISRAVDQYHKMCHLRMCHPQNRFVCIVLFE